MSAAEGPTAGGKEADASPAGYISDHPTRPTPPPPGTSVGINRAIAGTERCAAAAGTAGAGDAHPTLPPLPALPPVTPSPPDEQRPPPLRERKRPSGRRAEGGEASGAAAADGGAIASSRAGAAEISPEANGGGWRPPPPYPAPESEDSSRAAAIAATTTTATTTPTDESSLSSSAALVTALESTRLDDDDDESDPAPKRPRVGSTDKVAVASSGEESAGKKDNAGSVAKSNGGDAGGDDDDDWTKMSVESVVSDFDFSSSDGEEAHDDGADGAGAGGPTRLSRSFDANLVVRSIERGEAVLDRAEGRDVVLVVGKTGTGKSTLIQAIAGRTLTETTHTCRSRYGEEASKVVYEAAEDALPGFEIGHAKTSRTAHINCFDPKEGGNQKSSRLIYVDSPGFEDTNGHEVDIATSVMLSQVAKRCRSLRFVILISYVSLLEDRGGAMRSVLRLVRSFAKDFKEERQSFLFLFTHTNEIMGVPDDVEGARSCLTREVIRTKDGTTDEETLGVLDHIHKSLRKGHPFVDVFLPLKTDVAGLVGTIGEKMKSAKEPHLASNCGLTQASRLTLSGELQNQLQRLRRELHEESPDMERVKDSLKLFRYFNLYVSTEDVRKVILEADSEMQKFLKKQMASIETELDRGTLSDHDFGPANVSVVKMALSRLRTLQEHYPDHVDCDDILGGIKEALVKFQDAVKSERGCSFDEMHHHLGKLQAWAGGFSDFKALYEDTVKHLGQLILGLVDRAHPIDAKSITCFSFDELQSYVRNLSILLSISDNSEHLSRHMIDVGSARNAYQASVKAIRSLVHSWAKATSSFEIKAAIADDHRLRVLSERARSVEVLDELFEGFLLFPSLKEDTRKLRDRLANDVIECFKDLCAETAETDLYSSNAQSALLRLRTASELFGAIGGERWKNMVTPYNSLVVHAKAWLRARSGEVDEMSQTARDQGIRDGRREAQMLQSFGSFRWFDEFLPQEERFIDNCFTKFVHIYGDRISHVKNQASESIVEVMDDSQESAPAISALKVLLPELQQIELLALVMKDDIPSSIDDFRSKLQHHVQKFAQDASVVISEWNDTIRQNIREKTKDDQSVTVATERLEYVLREKKLLSGVNSSCDKILESVRTDARIVTATFAKDVNDQLESSGKYKAKAVCLALMLDLGKYTQVVSLLPEMGVLKEQVRNSIAADAKKIEELVSETSDWDDIDVLLTEFQNAVVLDEFTSNEASSRLRPLLQLREQKQAQVDTLLDTLILDQDFRGIREFLVPFAESKDQLKKQKFNQWRIKIGASLSCTIGAINRDLGCNMTDDVCLRVMSQLQILEQARSELQAYLKNLPGGLKLGKEIKNLKERINQKLRALLNAFDVNLRKSNYESMGINYHFIGILSTSMGVHLNSTNKNKAKSTKKEYDGAIRNVSKSVDKFVDSAFRDGTSLHQILPTLKNASECLAPKLLDLDSLYEETRKVLTTKLNGAFNTFSDGVSQSHCYCEAIEALSALNRHLGKGLRDHLIIDSLSFNCEAQLEEWREEQRKIDRELDFDGSNADEKLKSWASLLDGLDPTSSNSTFAKLKGIAKGYLSGTTYEKKVGDIETKVGERFTLGKKALKDSDFGMVQECVHILDLIECHVGKHIPTAKERSRSLKKQALDAFLATCEEAQCLLDSHQTRQFEAIFSDYRGVVKHMPCVIMREDAKKAFVLTNQVIHDALVRDISGIQDLLETLEFTKLKSKVQQTRRFGSFLADRCSLLHEEVKTCEHVEVDQWLDEIFKLCVENFSAGRSLNHVKHFAILEIPPSASKKDISKAYKTLAKKHHPDKTGLSDGAMFRRVKEAHDFLLDNINFSLRSNDDKPFDSIIRGIGTMLRERAKTYLDEQSYELVERMLFKLGDLKALNALVKPHLEHLETIGEVKELIRGHVKKVRVDVDSNWSERQYQALNENITDLRLMEDKFKAYPDIFSSSWNTGIIDKVESEIEDLGQRARRHLRSQKTAKDSLDDFKRCFLDMGHVLYEIPLFKNFTKSVMCDVLETCLGSDWGYSFLFEFGLGLQKGDENSSDEEKHVAQILVSEFSHFKEVMTMVWNEETSQKPADDTVNGIKGFRRTGGRMNALQIDKARLLESFTIFDSEYKKLLGEYIVPNADLNALVQKTLTIANKLKPLDCNSGWTDEVKRRVPHIIAGVFAVFTVLKSGASYNRLSESETGGMSEKLLMKPHNIQVLTLLSMFGCGASSSSSLDSQLMQIRTGEGKSMILGAAAVVLALLGFRARCVCYSEYLSGRDYALFQDIFDYFKVTEHVKYSKITTLSEDTTAAKGDIRRLTEGMLRGELVEAASAPDCALAASGDQSRAFTNTGGSSSAQPQDVTDASQCESASTSRGRKKGSRRKKKNRPSETAVSHPSNVPAADTRRKEILLVDEVDVFFGAEFYGRTYNQVAQLREPEIAEILNHIWIANKRGGRKQRLADIRALPAYSQLLKKLHGFKDLVDSEIALMIDQVRRVDEEPYYVDRETDRIGYKVMDTVSFEATYGYRTVFAYLQEAEKGNLKHKDSTLAIALAMPVSCGQFSYANISPERILGVSGTLSALGSYEQDVLSKYGVETFMYVPSVYGESNFQFDKAGEGIRIETNLSDYFHSITDQIQQMVKDKRSVVVFFRDTERLKDFEKSAFYRKLGRQKRLLTEDLSATDKEFVISKAATAGQVTISTAVFGRGTDFFCKDETVQRKGGMHVIQTFLSEEQSEEIQVQGRTARQGKKGSYQMILLDSDLEDQYGIARGANAKVAKQEWYDWLSKAREKRHKERCEMIEENLADASQKDQDTHRYFDALLAKDVEGASKRFKEIYKSFKKGSVPSSIELDLAFLVDVTGSMAPYARAATSTVNSMLAGSGSVLEKLKVKYPDITFQLRVGLMGYRDTDDGDQQFVESTWQGSGHFSDSVDGALQFLQSIANPTGGGDLAEDHLGAISRCANWNSLDDWTAPVKFMLLLTDAPAHGMVPPASASVANVDSYSVRHPDGLTVEKVADSLITRDIDLFVCSFNPAATYLTEEALSKAYLKHEDNAEQREIRAIPMVPAKQSQNVEVLGGHGKHIIFVLDQSGSMQYSWSGVVAAYNQYVMRRRQNQSDCDLVSVVQFDHSAHISVSMTPIAHVPSQLSYSGGGTQFHPAAQSACELGQATPSSHAPVVVFMSDGAAHDAGCAAGAFSQLNRTVRHNLGCDLELHVIAFGGGASTPQLQQIAGASRNGKLHTSADTAELSSIFVAIAGGGDVAGVLEAEIGKRISEAVSDRLALEYIA